MAHPCHASSPRASRGPDAAHVLLRSAVALAHARLSIVDIHGGTQPMQIVDGQLAITYNGELYNFQDLRAAQQESVAQDALRI